MLSSVCRILTLKKLARQKVIIAKNELPYRKLLPFFLSLVEVLPFAFVFRKCFV